MFLLPFAVVRHARLVQRDLRRIALGRIGQVEPRGLQPPLAVADLAHVGDVACLEREAVQHGGDLRVGILPLDFHDDAADAVARALVDVVDQIDLSRLIG